MSILDWLTGKMACPRCGTRGAKEINGQIHCPNPGCPYFSTQVAKKGTARPPAFDEPVDVPAGSVAIQYRNYRGQGKTFVAEIASARRHRNHLGVNVEPQGARIFLSRDRIANLPEVEAALPDFATSGQSVPSSSERKVLTYHQKRGSTSPLYQRLRAKYPDWEA